MATQANLKMFESDTDDLTIKVKDENGDYISLSGDTFFLTAKTSIKDETAEPILEKEVLVGGSGLKEAHIIFTEEDTKGLAGRYEYQIIWEPASGGRITLYYGAFQIDPTSKPVEA